MYGFNGKILRVNLSKKTLSVDSLTESDVTGVPATPSSKLTEARRIAQSAGLLHVYTGNVHDVSGGTTLCANCRQPLIVRDWHLIRDYAVTENGECPHCGAKLSGHFGKFEGQFGRKRIPVVIGGN